MNVVRASSGHQASISSSPILASSPSVEPRKHQPPHTSASSSQLATSSSRGKRQIACPLPLKVPFCASTTTTSTKSQPKQEGVSDFSDATRGDEWEERNVLFDDNFGYSGCHHTSPSANDDGESLINLIEAEWELEQIFRTAPVAANPHQRLARWMLNDEDHPLDLEEDGSPSWMLAEDHLPRLGFSPQEMMQEEEMVATPPPQLFVIPPSRARNPVPLNTPFQASSRVQQYVNSSPFYVEQLKQHQQQQLGDYDYDYRGLYAIEQRMEECSLLSPSSSSPTLAPPSPSSSTLGGHMRKRNRSYSDSMLKRDSLGDMTNNLVLVS